MSRLARTPIPHRTAKRISRAMRRAFPSASTLASMRVGAGALCALLASCQSIDQAASQAAEDFQNSMQRAHDANQAVAASAAFTVRGRLRLRDGQTLTCFKGVPTGYLGPADLSSPGWSSYNPATRKTTLHTAAIPLTVFTRGNVLTNNNCDDLAAQGLLEPASAAAAPARLATTLSPRTACKDVPPDLQDAYRRNCISFDPADPCSALTVEGTSLSDLAAICDARKASALWEKEQEYQRSRAGTKK